MSEIPPFRYIKNTQSTNSANDGTPRFKQSAFSKNLMERGEMGSEASNRRLAARAKDYLSAINKEKPVVLQALSRLVEPDVYVTYTYHKQVRLLGRKAITVEANGWWLTETRTLREDYDSSNERTVRYRVCTGLVLDTNGRIVSYSYTDNLDPFSPTKELLEAREGRLRGSNVDLESYASGEGRLESVLVLQDVRNALGAIAARENLDI